MYSAIFSGVIPLATANVPALTEAILDILLTVGGYPVAEPLVVGTNPAANAAAAAPRESISTGRYLKAIEAKKFIF